MSNFDLKKYLAEGRLLKEVGMEASFLPVDPIPGTTELTSDLFNSIKDKLITSGEKIINKIPKDQLMAMKSSVEKVIGPNFDKEDITMDNAKKIGKILMSQLNEESSQTDQDRLYKSYKAGYTNFNPKDYKSQSVGVGPNFADTLADTLIAIGFGALVTSPFFAATGVIAIGGLIAMVVAFIIGGVFGDKSYARSHTNY